MKTLFLVISVTVLMFCSLSEILVSLYHHDQDDFWIALSIFGILYALAIFLIYDARKGMAL